MADEDNAAVSAADAAAADTTRAVGESFLAAPTDDQPDDWHEPATRDDGVAIDGHGVPINLRLRAIHLADAGAREDPAGTLTPEDIAATAKRLALYDEAHPRITGRTALSDLTRIAEEEGVDISAAHTNAERAELITAARPGRI